MDEWKCRYMENNIGTWPDTSESHKVVLPVLDAVVLFLQFLVRHHILRVHDPVIAQKLLDPHCLLPFRLL